MIYDPKIPTGGLNEEPLDDEFPDFEDVSIETSQAHKSHGSSHAGAEPEKLHLSKIPLDVQLEVARVHVSLDELRKMEPGYRLPIDINPRLVNLIVNGKSIGRGEIVEIGEVVGVKILELYR